MKKKIVGIFICMLLIATAIPVVGSQNIVNPYSKKESVLIDNNGVGSLDRDEYTILYEDFEDDWVDDGEGDIAPEWWNMEQTSTETNSGNPCWWSQMEGLGNDNSNAAGLWWGWEYQNEWLITPPLDFSIYYDISLQFWTYNYGQFEDFWEEDLVKISIDGGEHWIVLANLYEEAPPDGGFFGEVLEFDLSEYEGEENVLLAFHRLTDDPNDCFGAWFIDDVLITGIPIPEIKVELKGGLFGYTATVTNLGNESTSGILDISVTTTDSWFILWGEELSLGDEVLVLDPNGGETYALQPVVGFGPALITLEVIIRIDGGPTLGGSAETAGFIFLFYVVGSCEATPITLP